MDTLQMLTYMIMIGLAGLVLMIFVMLAMAMLSAVERIRTHRSYHRMSPEERRKWRQLHHIEGDPHHAA
ncbi:hypothetical protein [Actinomadura geliboluensis]|uniref:hypothetical protein n=1 Tax=Actinomadura geliboluensis TaxID=882440 RepID=UPI00260BDC31|nr:hypothetical protein [Actinomadura geliboluensis]